MVWQSPFHVKQTSSDILVPLGYAASRVEDRVGNGGSDGGHRWVR